MKKLFLAFICILTFSVNIVNAKIFEGNVSEMGLDKTNKLIDAETHAPITNATVSLPQKNYTTKTDNEGSFSLKADINGSTILSVKKEGYKPFSLTINDQIASRPMTLGIEKSTPKDIAIESSMFHLGDNNYSDVSANAGEFRVQTIGPFYSKKFRIEGVGTNAYLIIGSIIGVDTKMARSMGQNHIISAFSSPPEVFFNGVKIAEIQLNGDNQRIRIPKNIIQANKMNDITIKTGRNLMQNDYIDYDDIEFMNLSIEND